MTAKPDLWMPLYLGSYIADTLRFTTEQHGAYLLLIFDYWRNGPPPDDDQVLAQISKLSLARWKAHRVVIEPKFKISGGTWKHKRIEQELGRARDNQENLSERGKAGAAARWNKDSSSNATGNATGNAQGNASAMLADAPRPLPRPLPTSPLPGPTPGPSPSPEGQKPSERRRKSATASAPTGETWRAYGAAYRHRYGVDPTGNAKVNGMLARFLERVPLAEAPDIAAFYVTSNRSFYTQGKHPIDLLLRDAEAIRTEWQTGRTATDTAARQGDRTAAQGDVWKDLLEESLRIESPGEKAA